MKNKLFQSATALVLACACATGAQAATLYSAGSTGELATDTAFSASVNAGAGAGLVSFQLQGYRTLDGDNAWIDIFHLTVNGAEVFTGTWDLGGGGGGPSQGLIFGTPGTTVTQTDLTVDVAVPVSLLAGLNTVTFAYESPANHAGSARAGFQGLGDEAWGVNAATVTGHSPVPEPSSYALIMAGLLAAAGVSIGRGKQTP